MAELASFKFESWHTQVDVHHLLKVLSHSRDARDWHLEAQEPFAASPRQLIPPPPLLFTVWGVPRS